MVFIIGLKFNAIRWFYVPTCLPFYTLLGLIVGIKDPLYNLFPFNFKCTYIEREKKKKKKLSHFFFFWICPYKMIKKENLNSFTFIVHAVKICKSRKGLAHLF